MANDDKRPETALQSILYISLPEQLVKTIGDFVIDPDILIPVEVMPGQEAWDMGELSWEMIIAAMLKILVYDPENPNADYYRRFALSAQPNLVHELTQTGIAKAKQKDFHVAEELFKALVRLNPGDVTAPLNLALIYEEHADVYGNSGRESFAEEYRELAFETYRELLSAAPDNEYVSFNAAHFFLKQRSFARAKELFERYLDVATDKKKQSMVRKLLEELEGHDTMDKLFSESYDYIQMGREKEGIEKIRAFIEVNAGVWNAWFLLGWGFRRMEQYEEGKKAFAKALELGPAQTDTLNELAICQMELGEFDDCRTTLRRALELEPENVKIMSNLGILLLKENKPEEARGLFEAVLDLESEDPIALSYIDYLNENH